MTQAISQVTATSLNLRAAPGGAIVGVLLHGDTLDILAAQDGWAHVSVVKTPGKLGWVNQHFITAGAAPAIAPIVPTAPIVTVNPVPVASSAAPAVVLPPAEDDTHQATVQGVQAITPGGHVFARSFKQGFYTSGETSMAAWLATLTTPPVGIGGSARRAVRAVCINEGGLEAINSYDNAFLSVGVFQWTSGRDDGPGELALLLTRLRAADAAAYDDCFGRYGLSAAVAAGAFAGTLSVNGSALVSAAAKAQLRDVHWAYRFWRAGHHPSFRSAELSLAASRLDRFLELPLHGRTVRGWLTSEYAVALVLDEHVNRPGHVPGTLQAAFQDARAADLPADPGDWTTANEGDFLEIYLHARAQTNMTDSDKRALKIGECVRAGQLSDQRGSFVR